MDKEALIRRLSEILEEKMQTAWAAMEAAQESANDQSKSSAGDKYETARSMGQLDRNMHARQFEQVRQERVFLERISASAVTGRVVPGSLVNTSAGWFFIGVSLGPLEWEGTKLIALSASSPVGAALSGRQAGESFSFMNKEHQVIAVN